MAEKGVKTERNGNLRALGTILIPFVIYYAVNFVTAVILTVVVENITSAIGGTWEKVWAEQKTTVSAVIGGMAMLSGILPLFSGFRCEIQSEKKHQNENRKNNTYENNCRNDKKQNNNMYNNTKLPSKVSFASYETTAILMKVLLTITVAFSSSITLNILFIALHLTESSETYGQVAAHQYGVIFPIGLLLYGIVSPYAEEVVFRGIIYNRMKKNGRDSSAAVPIILSALLFGMYHGNIVQMLYGFLMGILIAYVYEKGGRFLYAFLFHAAANVTVYVITGNSFLYERFITPYAGIVFAGVSVLLLYLLRRVCFPPKCQKEEQNSE